MKVSLWAEIRRLHEIEGLTGRAIARRLHCCTKTVSKALAMPSPPAPTPEPRDSILDPYRAQIDALMAKYPDLSAVRVPEEISRGEDGYRGSVYPVRRYLRQVRPARGRVYQEVIYEPGEAMQVDWGDCGRLTIGQTTRRVSVFVAVLCYSRLCYIEFSLSQRKADFYRALVHALEFFQGSPRKIIFDNLKAAVHQRFGPVRLLASRVPGPVRLLLHGADRLRSARPGIERDRGGKRAVRQTQCPGRPQRRTGDVGGLPASGPAVARRGGQCPPARHHHRAPHRPLPERTPSAAPLAGHALRHRRDSLRRRHALMPGSITTATATPCRRRWSARPVMLRANATRGADSRSGPGSRAASTLLREGPVARPSRPPPGGLETASASPGRPARGRVRRPGPGRPASST